MERSTHIRLLVPAIVFVFLGATLADPPADPAKPGPTPPVPAKPIRDSSKTYTMTGIDGNNIIGYIQYHHPPVQLFPGPATVIRRSGPVNRITRNDPAPLEMAPASSPKHGIIYYNGKLWVPFDVPRTIWTEPMGISGKAIVGRCACETRKGNEEHAFYCEMDKNSFTAIDVPGMSMTRPKGVSGKRVIGECYAEDGKLRSFLYDGRTSTLLTMPGAESLSLNGISGNKIVGVYVDASKQSHGVVYDGKAWTTLDIPGIPNAFPASISDNTILGAAEGKGPFFYDLDTKTVTMIDLPPGVTSIQPIGLSGKTILASYLDASKSSCYVVYDGKAWTPLEMPKQ